jgi:uncharacterized protein YjdB
LLAQLKDDKGEQFDVSQTAMWSSSDPSIATAAGGGLVAGVSAGMVTITAARDGQSGGAQVMIVAHDIATISVAPTPVTLGRGDTLQLTATAHLSDSSMVDVTQNATWSSNNLAAVTCTKGLLTGVAFGQATVNAASEAIVSNNVAVTVGQGGTVDAGETD